MFLSKSALSIIIILLLLIIGVLIADVILNKKNRIIEEKIYKFTIERLTILSKNKNINQIIIHSIPEEFYLQAFFLIEKISKELKIPKNLFSFEDKLCDVLIVSMIDIGEINLKKDMNSKDIFSYNLLFIIHKYSSNKKLTEQLKKWNKTVCNEDDWLDLIMNMTIVELLLFFSPTVTIKNFR
jgi:hypothetical protein